MRSEKATLTVLARLAGRVPEQAVLLEQALSGRLDHLLSVATDIAIQTGGPIPSVLAKCLKAEGTTELATYVTEHVPTQASCLRPVRLWALHRRLEALPEDPLIDLELGRERGSQLLFLAMEHQELGDQKTALALANEALNVQRKLLDNGLGAETPITLRVLASILFELGDLPRALTTMTEATKLYALLAERDPAAFLEHLATAQSEEAEVLDELDQTDAATTLRQDAISNLQCLLDDHTPADPIDRVDALHTLGSLLAEEERLDEAQRVLEEAIDIQYDLTDARPQQFDAALAENLYQLGNVLRRRGETGLAIPSLEAAVTLWQAVVDLGTAGALPELARTKGKLAECYYAEGNPEEAQHHAEAAIRDWDRVPQGSRGAVRTTELAELWTLVARTRLQSGDVVGARAAQERATAFVHCAT